MLSQGAITASAFPMTLPETQLTYTYNGSAALFKATQSLGLSSADVVLLPAYCCGAEIGPFEQLSCELLFYDIDQQLNVDTQQIAQLITHRSDIKAVLITHYFGFAQLDILRIKQLCFDANIALIEDCAHSLYSSHNNKPLGSYGTHAIFSPRKSLPLTEGGLFTTNNPASSNSAVSVPTKPDLLPWLQRALYSIQQFYRSDKTHSVNNVLRVLNIGFWGAPAVVVKVLKRMGLFKNAIWLTADAEGDAATPIYNVGMSQSMQTLLHRVRAQDVVRQRRDNYQCWLNELSNNHHNTHAEPLFKQLPDECCPLYFPLLVNNPAEMVEALKLADIESFNWWQHMHNAIDWEQFPVAKKMKQSIVALPVHQKLDRTQIRRMADRVNAVLEQ